MAVKEKQIESPVKIEWTPENEVQLFLAMNGHKPVGVNKFFHIVCIWEKFRAAVDKDISLKVIWDHLSTLYDLVSLDETEDLPFPSEYFEFSLPDSDFLDLKNKKKEQLDTKDAKQKEKEKTEVKEKPKETKKEKEKEAKEVVKRDTPSRESKVVKEQDKKKEEPKKTVKEPETKKEKQKEATKDVKKEIKTLKTRPKGKEDSEETVAVPAKKERRDSDSNKSESTKRVAVKRPTRQSADSVVIATSSPRDTPPLKRRRL